MSEAFSRRQLIRLLGLTAGASLLAACAPAAPPAATSVPAAKPTDAPKPAAPAATAAPAGKPAAPAASTTIGPRETLVYGLLTDPQNLDPQVGTDSLAMIAIERAYERLVDIERGPQQPGAPINVVPGLAESWREDKGGLEYTFKLRPGRKFSDGSPLDAKAVQFSFDRMIAIKNTAASNIPQLKSTEAVDDLTVRMTLTEPFAYFLPSLAIYASGIVNPKVMDFAKDNDWGQAYLAGNAMGSGPYKFVEWQRGSQLVMEYNPNWPGKVPAIRRVVLRMISEGTNLKLQLERGDIDVMWPLSISEMLPLEGKPGVRVTEVPTPAFILAYLNNQKPPFDQVAVRQAVSYAINYDQIIKEVIGGKGRRARGPLGFGMEGYDESLKGYDYDPGKAKQLLAQAGFPNGFDTTITYSTAAPGAEEVALIMQAQLGAIGIRAQTEKIAEAARRERIDKSEFAISPGGWAPPIPIPPWTMEKWYNSTKKGLNSNRAFYGNPKVDDLVLKAPAVLDAEKRIAMYREAQQIVVDEAPYVLFYQFNTLVAMRDTIEGFQPRIEGAYLMDYEVLSKKT